ncbi:MAG: DNA-binding response regulator [Methylocystaceae bacterium]|jgi:two-component system OmpR family response regulator|uniref:response regulator transcription factor n=1 Tax=Methylosinus sp. LW3 TaxID=107635 RepID=UPI0004640A7D|nr:response regulator transcription factor [Methylosinus sp. LW3]PWB83540.1 MAG: DNA-binding response regulator [Methylocystaceae bacterium]
MRVLLVEDDERIARNVKAALGESGYVVDHERDGEQAWFKGDTEDYAAVVLDLGLPSLDGLSILKKWRANERSMPILILTSRDTWLERVEGINAGADDYLPKPFVMEELLARLRAIVRRSAGVSTPIITIGSLSLDTRQMRVTREGAPVNLTPQEYRLLSYLMHHSGRIVPHGELLEQLFSHDCDKESNAIEVLIGRVRKKIGLDCIETRRGFGYIIGQNG